jgi:hypothetical protein
MYFDYFKRNSHVSFLDAGKDEADESSGITDMAMAVYAWCELYIAGGYEKSAFTMDEMDATVDKFFGKVVENYNSQMLYVIPETMEITPTGWGGSSTAWVLKDRIVNAGGVITGTFYVYAFGLDSYPDKDDILQLRLDYHTPNLVTLVFEERMDSNRELYLFYHDIVWHGEAQKPYRSYQG